MPISLGDLRVPGQRVQVHQHGARGVGRLGEVQPALGAAGHVPDQPGVHVAEGQVTGLGALAGALDVVQNPAHLGAGEVGRQRQTHLGLVAFGATPERAELLADRVGAGVLPDDRVVDRLAGRAVPHQRGLALVGDPDRGDVGRGDVGLGQRAGDDLTGVVPDLGRVVLDPAGLREDLLVFHLVGHDDPAVAIEDHTPGGGRSLVDCSDELLAHRTPFWVGGTGTGRCAAHRGEITGLRRS